MAPVDKLSYEQICLIDEWLPSLIEGEIVLVQGYESSAITSVILHRIDNLYRIHENVSIVILVPNNLSISILESQILELNIENSNIQIRNYFTFIQNNNKKFDYIFVIEAMELTFDMIRNLSEMANRLILSNIFNISNNINPYTKEASISIEEIGLIVNRIWNLSTIYRLNRMIKVISSLIPSMSDILLSKPDNKKIGLRPLLAKASSKEKEVEYIISNAQTKLAIGENSVIVLPTQKDVIEFMNIVCKLHNINMFSSQKGNYLTELNQYLKNNDIDIAYIGNKNANQLFGNINQGKIIVLSYKNIRFIKFDNIFLPFFSEKLDIDTNSLISAIESVELSLCITYSGTMHEFVERIESNCNKVDIDKILSQSNNSKDFNDDFDF